MGPAAYEWLSRGAHEALLAFIARANGASFALRGAIYEFQWPTVLAAIKQAHADGADVKVIYDGIDKDSGPKAKNEAAIDDANIKGLCKARTEGTLMHNKFIVLLKNDQPVAVLTEQLVVR